MRRFYLVRDRDLSGMSGTGRVAEGVEFTSGLVALHFDPNILGVKSVITYYDLGDMYIVHGHSGGTRIVWVDQTPIKKQVNRGV